MSILPAEISDTGLVQFIMVAPKTEVTNLRAIYIFVCSHRIGRSRLRKFDRTISVMLDYNSLIKLSFWQLVSQYMKKNIWTDIFPWNLV